MKRFLIEPGQAESGRVRLTGVEARHACQVLRLTPGELVLVVDGRGGEWRGRIIESSRTRVDIEVTAEVHSIPEPELQITLGLALIKPDLLELVVQKGTELGLATLVPLITSRTTMRLKGVRAGAKLERWREIARQAIKQCRRGRPLEVREAVDIKTFIQEPEPVDLKLIFHPGGEGDPGVGLKDILRESGPPGSIKLLIGPEGGFDPGELQLALEAGFRPAVLGPRILRSETAALAAISILGFELGDIA